MAVNNNLSRMSIDELLGMRAGVDGELKVRMHEMRLSIDEINAALGTGKAGGSSLIGRKVAVKYRHPETGEEWTGRGGVAGWLARELAAGKSRDEFLVRSH